MIDFYDPRTWCGYNTTALVDQEPLESCNNCRVVSECNGRRVNSSDKETKMIEVDLEWKDGANSLVTLMQKRPSKKTPEGGLPIQTILPPPQVPRAGATGTDCQMSGQLSNLQKLTSQPPQPIGDTEQDHITPDDQPGPTMNEKATGMEKHERGQPS